jgi:hypothetical protein
MTGWPRRASQSFDLSHAQIAPVGRFWVFALASQRCLPADFREETGISRHGKKYFHFYENNSCILISRSVNMRLPRTGKFARDERGPPAGGAAKSEDEERS